MVTPNILRQIKKIGSSKGPIRVQSYRSDMLQEFGASILPQHPTSDTPEVWSELWGRLARRLPVPWKHWRLACHHYTPPSAATQAPEERVHRAAMACLHTATFVTVQGLRAGLCLPHSPNAHRQHWLREARVTTRETALASQNAVLKMLQGTPQSAKHTVSRNQPTWRGNTRLEQVEEWNFVQTSPSKH